MSFRRSKMKWSKCIRINTVNNLKQLLLGIHLISILQNLDDLNLIPFLYLSPYIHFALPNLHFPLLLLITFFTLLTQLTRFNIWTFISLNLLLSQSLFIFLFLLLLCWRIISKFISLIIIIIITYIIVILWVMHSLSWPWSIRTLLLIFIGIFRHWIIKTLPCFYFIRWLINCAYLGNWVNTWFIYSFC